MPTEEIDRRRRRERERERVREGGVKIYSGRSASMRAGKEEMYVLTDRRIDRQTTRNTSYTDLQTCRHTDGRTDRQAGRRKNGLRDRKTGD